MLSKEAEDLPEEGEANNTNDNTPVNTTPQNTVNRD